MHGTVADIDMNHLICGPVQCAPVVGNVLVWVDDHHHTSACGKTLTPYLDSQLLASDKVLAAHA